MATRILVIGQRPPPVHGSNVMTELFMQALSANGYDATIVEKTFSHNLNDVGKVSIKKALKIPDLCRRVVAAIEDFKPDCCVYFISIGLRSLLVDCLVIRFIIKHNIPYILYFHGMGLRNYENNRYFPVRNIIRETLSNALGGLVLGERLKHDVNQCIPNNRLYVLPNCIPQTCAVQNSLSRKDDSYVRVIFLSNLIPTKGPMNFLMMAKFVSKQEPRARFSMAGSHASESYLNELKQFVGKEGLEHCVEFLGPVYGNEKDQLFSKADLFVFPTYFPKEAFGLVNLEAMHYGIPVISSNVGAIPDVIQDGVNGYIVDPKNIDEIANKVLNLIRDPSLRERLGRNGKKLFEQNYSLNAYNRNLRQAIDYLIYTKT